MVAGVGRWHGRRARALQALLVAILVLAPGCGPRVSTRAFTLQARPEANDRSPVPVEVVLVKDEALVAALAALSARAWFDSRLQLARDHPDAFETRQWELVPGQRLEVEFPFGSRRGSALFVFANYLSAGAHRVRVDRLERFTIILEGDGFVIAEGDAPVPDAPTGAP